MEEVVDEGNVEVAREIDTSLVGNGGNGREVGEVMDRIIREWEED